jgi:C-terminal processing protease CtpA/Prc
MKKRFALLLIIAVFLFNAVGCSSNTQVVQKNQVSQNKQLTQKEKLDDFEYMYNILKENYPYFEVNKRQNNVDWLSNKEEYISIIKSTDDDKSFFDALNVILSELNNGHTGILDSKFYHYFDDICKQYPKEFEAWLKQLDNSKAVKRYKDPGDDPSNSQSSGDEITPNNIETKILKDREAAYLSIKTLNSFNIEGDMKIIAPFLKKIKNYKALIIDIRGNGGGDTRYWSDNLVPMLIDKPLDCTQYEAYRGGSFTEQFLKCRSGKGYEACKPISNIKSENLKNLPPELKKDFKYYSTGTARVEPKNSIGFNGRIYMLIDDGVFSSSEAFASFAKGTGFATLVGETTGGDGIGSDPAVCVLPNSGYIFRFTKEMGLNPDGSSNFEYKTQPDIKVSAKKGSDISNDEAIKAVLKLSGNK